MAATAALRIALHAVGISSYITTSGDVRVIVAARTADIAQAGGVFYGQFPGGDDFSLGDTAEAAAEQLAATRARFERAQVADTKPATTRAQPVLFEDDTVQLGLFDQAPAVQTALF